MILPVREPYDWALVLDWLGTRAIPGLEAVEDGVYRRGATVVARVERRDRGARAGRPGASSRACSTPATTRRRSPADAAVRARARDPRAGRVERVGAGRARGPRAAGQRRGRAPDGGEAGRAARRLPGAGGDRGRRRAAGDAGVRAARALRALAGAVAGGLRLDPPLDLAATRAELLALPGFGPWTVEYVAMRALRDPDAWPASDLWLKRAADAAAGGAVAAVAGVCGDGAVAGAEADVARPGERQHQH